ncbi:hypothetical protein DFS33DRAFT_853474 [Desarmillaria ectypa]|nr:hypothetical protein DFS33DRAFT_853474 [Desarmillaria ectypa]
MLTVLPALTIILINLAVAEVVPFLEPGFFFDYNKADEPVPILLTQQCEVIHLKWDRREAIGQNPVAPYSLLVYTSTSETANVIDAGSGLSFDWAVPFPPGTQFDVNGVSGGCQDMYTMIPNSNGTDISCPNVTSMILSASGTVSQPSGPMSRFGFINQCADVSVMPSEGTPPFTLTIAPALHPPYNLTSNTTDAITWIVSLSRAMPFFMSMVSSEGNIWANGPLHVGVFGPTDCLAPGTVNADHAKSVAARAGVGGFFGGAAFVAGVFVALSIWRRRRQEMQQSGTTEDFTPFNDHRSSIAIIGYPQGLGMSREERRLDGVSSLLTLSELSPAYASSGVHPSRVFDTNGSAQNQALDAVEDLPPSYSYSGRLGPSREQPCFMSRVKSGR